MNNKRWILFLGGCLIMQVFIFQSAPAYAQLFTKTDTVIVRDIITSDSLKGVYNEISGISYLKYSSSFAFYNRSTTGKLGIIGTDGKIIFQHSLNARNVFQAIHILFSKKTINMPYLTEENKNGNMVFVDWQIGLRTVLFRNLKYNIKEIKIVDRHTYKIIYLKKLRRKKIEDNYNGYYNGILVPDENVLYYPIIKAEGKDTMLSIRKYNYRNNTTIDNYVDIPYNHRLNNLRLKKFENYFILFSDKSDSVFILNKSSKADSQRVEVEAVLFHYAKEIVSKTYAGKLYDLNLNNAKNSSVISNQGIIDDLFFEGDYVWCIYRYSNIDTTNEQKFEIHLIKYNIANSEIIADNIIPYDLWKYQSFPLAIDKTGKDEFALLIIKEGHYQLIKFRI